MYFYRKYIVSRGQSLPAVCRVNIWWSVIWVDRVRFQLVLSGGILSYCNRREQGEVTATKYCEPKPQVHQDAQRRGATERISRRARTGGAAPQHDAAADQGGWRRNTTPPPSCADDGEVRGQPATKDRRTPPTVSSIEGQISHHKSEKRCPSRAEALRRLRPKTPVSESREAGGRKDQPGGGLMRPCDAPGERPGGAAGQAR